MDETGKQLERPANGHSRFTLRELLLLLLVAAVAIGWWVDRTRLVQKYTVDYPSREAAATVKVGMSKDDVRAIMGEPHKTNRSVSMPFWTYYFDEKKLDTGCVFFGKDDRVHGLGNMR